MKFNTPYNQKTDSFGQTFNAKEIKETKGGKTYFLYDKIQAANIDTDIKEVLKKYGCSVNQAAEYMKSKGGIQGIFAEIDKIQEKAQNLPELQEVVRKSEEMFLNLPTEIREKYGNNLENFLRDKDLFMKKQKAQKVEANNDK